MSTDDPTPLAKPGDPLVHALLRAGRRERAPKGAEQRMLAVLGASASTSAFAGASDVFVRLGLKGVLLSTVGVLAITGAVVWASRQAPPPPARPVLAPEAPSPVRASPPPPAEISDVPTTRVEDLPTSKPVAAPRPAPEPAGLAREVELVEAARAALARGDAPAALRSLDAHDREIPDGTLMPESRLLRQRARAVLEQTP